jgi:tetratricopeptide (TPR) repeat protein
MSYHNYRDRDHGRPPYHRGSPVRRDDRYPSRGNSPERPRQFERRDNRKDAEFDEYVRKADALFSDDRYTESIPLYEQALQIRPNHLHALFFVGRALASLNQYDRALQYFDQVIEQRNDHIPALSAKGYALCMLGHHEEALHWVDRALDLGPNHARTLGRKGAILEVMGHNDEAVRFYDKALNFNPRDIHTLVAKGKLLVTMGRYRQAIEECLDIVLDHYPEHAVSISQKAIAMMNLGRTEEAIHMLDRYIRMPPQSPKQARLMRTKGVLLYTLRQYLDAITWFDHSLSAERDHTGTLINKGLCLYALQRYEEAIRSYEDALRLEPNNETTRQYRHLASTRLEKRKNRTSKPMEMIPSGFDTYGSLLNKRKNDEFVIPGIK